MSPASKATAPKKVPASRAPAAPQAVVKKKSQRAVPSAKKAVMTKKTAPEPKSAPAPKSAAAAAKKQAPVVKKTVSSKPPASPNSHAGKAAKATTAKATTAKSAKRAAVAKKAPKATKASKATKKETPEPAQAPAATRTIKTLGSRPKAAPPVRPKTGPYAKETKFLDEQKDLLLADRAIYQEQATSLRAEADSLALEREPGDVQFDEESGEGGTVTVDRERNLALSGQAALAVEEIDYALERLADKTYGYCERCFQPIPKPRLRALPYARLCVACKSGGLSRR
ncbi:MAG: TraR/DksA family transcriptional regulator [Acidimicrobiales bacterium]